MSGLTARSAPIGKRVRVMLSGSMLADSLAVKLLRETGGIPLYAFPLADVAMDRLRPTASNPALLDVTAGDRVVSGAARLVSGKGPDGLEGHVVFDWHAMDSWLEEDEEVFHHARDPEVRVDILASRRRVTVTAGGVTVAETTRALFLFETGEPVCPYMPLEDVRADLLVASDYLAGWPYKGQARHHHIRVAGRLFENALDCYDDPVPESRRIAGLWCFDPAHVDAVTITPR